MTPADFIAKWRSNELKERSASQSHFNDLCALLGVVDPTTADSKGDWFAFEKGASKTSGGEGWADVWRKGCFAWEYKGRHANLDKANQQLLQYSVALENPPLLIVSDMDRIVIRTNWTNTVQELHEFTLDDLLDGAVRGRLKAVFTDPDEFKPSKTRQELTEETAGEFAGLAQRLRNRGHEPIQVAHFVNRLVFCMFAEDVDLLPDDMFTKMLKASDRKPESFATHAGTLFAAMATGGLVGFTQVDWFNGGLFDDDSALPLDADDIESLLKAAKRDWSQIDPSILGTLFERGLDPAKRSQLGAHYTDRDKIMMIVKPVIFDPLEAEWAGALAQMAAIIDSAPKRTKDRLLTPAEKRKAEKLIGDAAAIHNAFVERLVNFRVLDPACGSGNFLYVALRSLKDLEHRANLDAEALGLPRGFPRVGPESVLGIELNPYAAELARVSVWIGEIQWMRRNGFDAAKNPILRTLDTIECRDAVLNEDGTRAEWPVADAVVGNPPFLGNKKMIGELGEDYAVALRKAWSNIPGGVDLVCYWFAAAWDMMAAGKLSRAGLVATNSIRGGTNREVLKPIADNSRIFDAWSDEQWTVDGASVRVSLICFNDATKSGSKLNGVPVDDIFADLTGHAGAVDLTQSKVLATNSNLAFQGVKFGGPFAVDTNVARDLVAAVGNPNGLPNSSVVRRWTTGLDLTRRVEERWCLDFGGLQTADDAALFEKPYEVFESQWRAENLDRQNKNPPASPLRANEAATLATPWLHQRPRPEMRVGLTGLKRCIATPEVSKHRVFVWLPKGHSGVGLNLFHCPRRRHQLWHPPFDVSRTLVAAHGHFA